MKEKIAEIIGRYGDMRICTVVNAQIPVMKALLKQEIEKVENELIFIKTVPSMGDDLLKWHYDKGFKDCRQAILKILT